MARASEKLCTFQPGEEVVYRPSQRGYDLDVMSERLTPGKTYRIRTVTNGMYITVDGYAHPGGGLYWTEFERPMEQLLLQELTREGAYMDWTECELVERVEGRCGGRPTLLGSRIWPEIFIDGAADGMSVEEMHEQFPSISVEQIRGVLASAQRKRSAA